ncbi:MAG: SCO family protein [Flavobacteriaceae bacterium]|nr:SCO family protein [Flavobacteriaceae bacterium]
MKTNYSYIGISFVILVFGILFIPKIINRINNQETVDLDRHHLERKSIPAKDSLVTIGTVPAFHFIDQNKDTISNQTFSGKVYVVEFFFSTCPSICPIMNQNMKKVEQVFLAETNMAIASITINPSYDTPEVLKEYASKYEVTKPNWYFLTGIQTEIYSLANEGFNLYVGETPEIEGGFEHSGFFALIDKNGNIRSRIDENGNPIIYYNGLEESGIEMLIADIKKLLKE